MKKKVLLYAYHLCFIISILSIGFGVSGYTEMGLFLVIMGFGVIFHLWRNNYFTRNKS